MTKIAHIYTQTGTFTGVIDVGGANTPFSVGVVPFEASVTPLTGGVGQVFTITANGPISAIQALRNDVPVSGASITGTTTATYTAVSGDIGAALTFLVTPLGVQDPVEPGVTVTAPTASLEFVLGAASWTNNTGTPRTFTFDTSLLEAGDKLAVVLSGASVPATNTVSTINGVSAGSPIFTDGSLDGNRHAVVYEYTMPTAGNSTMPIVVEKGGGNATHVTIWGYRGGSIASRGFSASNSVLTRTTSVTPAVATNLILASMHQAGDTVVTWTGVTAQHVASGAEGGGRTRGATATNVPASALTVTADQTFSQRMSLLVLCVEPD